MKKQLSIFLIAIMVVLSSQTAWAGETVSSVEGTDNICAVDIAEQLGGEAISPEDVPEGVIPMEFDSVEEAKEYLREQEEVLDEIESVNVNSDAGSAMFGVMSINSNTGVKEKTFAVPGILLYLTMYVKYSSNGKKFTAVNSVKSSLTGPYTIGNEWVQDTYASVIKNKGRKLKVTLKGHFNHYIMINTQYTKIGSSKKTYRASWDY